MHHTTRHLEDCFITVDGPVLTIGNCCISRRFDMQKGAFLDITDRLTNKVYSGETPIQNPVINLQTAETVLHCFVEDHWGASESFLTARIDYARGDTVLSIRFSVFPGLPYLFRFRDPVFCKEFSVIIDPFQDLFIISGKFFSFVQ